MRCMVSGVRVPVASCSLKAAISCCTSVCVGGAGATGSVATAKVLGDNLRRKPASASALSCSDTAFCSAREGRPGSRSRAPRAARATSAGVKEFRLTLASCAFSARLLMKSEAWAWRLDGATVSVSASCGGLATNSSMARWRMSVEACCQSATRAALTKATVASGVARGTGGVKRGFSARKAST